MKRFLIVGLVVLGALMFAKATGPSFMDILEFAAIPPSIF